MKILLLLNGPDGCQTGIEDGFSYLKSTGAVSELEWLYLDELITTFGIKAAINKTEEFAASFQPTLIAIFHIGKIPITNKFISSLKNLPSKPILVYDEGDMYGGWSKPITTSMSLIIRAADVVSLRGLGQFRAEIAKLNNKIIYTPHHADIARFDVEPFLLSERENKLTLIGNRVASRLGPIRRLPGAKGREQFVRAMGEAFGNDFVLHGNGWDGFIGNRGPVDFYKQLDVYRTSWITVAYEHYPAIPYYFSNRLPIALLAGSLYVCHYHEGYENIFKDCDFIFFFKKDAEAIDLITYIHSLSSVDLLSRATRARAFALKYFHPNVTWSNFVQNIQKATRCE
jgi:hypothetical protein